MPYGHPNPTITAPLRLSVVASEADDDAVSWCLELARSDRMAVDAIVLGNGARADELERRGIRTRALRVGGGKAGNLWAGAALWSRLRQTSPDLVVLCGPAAGAIAVPAARLAGARVAWVGQPGSGNPRGISRLVDTTLAARLGDSDGRERLAAQLAEAACRPGAGLTGGPPVSLVTTVLNEGPAVDRLLQGVVPQLRRDDEAIVVDGGSSDDTVDRIAGWIRRDPRIRLLRAPGANIAAGRNRGVDAATHPVVACTDAGCTVADGWLDALRAPFGEPDPPSLVTGIYRAVGDRSIDQAMAVANYPSPQEARRPGPLVRAYGRLLGRVYDPTLCTGRSMAVTVDAWRAAGGFPEHLAIGEDVTFGRSVARTGRRCVLAVDAEVEWSPRPSLAATARMYHSYGRGDGESRDRLLIARNLARALAYVSAIPLWSWGGRAGRLGVTVGAATYLSLPVARGLRRERPVAVLVRVPLALALKDLAKAVGCLRALTRHS
jgi:glycosyltransferase involved in cell wall biosynthesis